jgi:hypothetical protein
VRLWLAALLLAGCDCPDLNGNRSDFHAGPAATELYSISADRECPAVGDPLEQIGVITISGRSPLVAGRVDQTWIERRLVPVLAAQHLQIKGFGTGTFCDPAGPPFLYVKVSNWFHTDDVARAIALQLTIDQLQGDVALVVEPLRYLC